MSSRNKLKRFAAIKTFPNVFEFPKDMRNTWHNTVFSNSNPIIVELACGKGAYTLAIAEQHPEINTIGVDLKAERLYVGSKAAQGLLPEEQLPVELKDYTPNALMNNVAFLRCKIEELDLYFAPNEIAEIWITFPDPFPRQKQAKHRLTSPDFLTLYKQLLPKGGLIHLKTDDVNLFEYSLETAYGEGFSVREAVTDIYAQTSLPHPLLAIQTPFERKHLAKGRTIQYLQLEV